MQSRFMSLVEALANILVGLSTSFVANAALLPMVTGHALPTGQNVILVVLFTGVSLVRSYVLRRWFAKRTG